jgi:hypothetical protein
MSHHRAIQNSKFKIQKETPSCTDIALRAREQAIGNRQQATVSSNWGSGFGNVLTLMRSAIYETQCCPTAKYLPNG